MLRASFFGVHACINLSILHRQGRSTWYPDVPGTHWTPQFFSGIWTPQNLGGGCCSETAWPMVADPVPKLHRSKTRKTDWETTKCGPQHQMNQSSLTEIIWLNLVESSVASLWPHLGIKHQNWLSEFLWILVTDSSFSSLGPTWHWVWSLMASNLLGTLPPRRGGP